jgi:hypothetical protein
MPSPFPGMDPYLEGSEWTSVHTELSSEIARQLAPKLRPKYIVRATRRFVTDMPAVVTIAAGDVYPDVSVFGGSTIREPAPSLTTTTAVPLEMATVMPARIPLITIEIRDVTNRELVTAIELLSPVNKHGRGYREYLEKRQRLLSSTTHLLEIDLLRNGRRVPMQQPLPAAPYFVFLSRAEKRPILEVWPIQLNEKLPTVPIPLLSGDADASLDLQLALDTIYDALGYDLSVDYASPPDIPLKGEWAIWAAERLNTAGQ